MDLTATNDLMNTSLTTQLTYSIPGLDTGSSSFTFAYISKFLALITPYDLPLNLVRDALHSNLTWIDFANKSLQIESGFIVIMTLLVIMSFIPLCATIAWCCKKRSEDELYNNEEPINPLMLIDDSLENSIHCQRRVSITILFILFLVLITCDIVLFVTNSRLSKAIEMTPEVIEASIYDTKVFLKNTHVQIKYQLDNGLDHAIDNVTKDLHDHSKTQKHINATEPFSSSRQKTIQFQKLKVLEKAHESEARSSLFIAKHSAILSVDHYTKISKLNYTDSNICANVKLSRTKCSGIISNVWYPYFISKLTKDVQNSPYSLIIDESTDISIIKYLGVVIKYYSKSDNICKTNLLKLQPLDACDSNAIVSAILDLLKEYGLNIKNMCGLGTDNANVMTGIRNGVFAKLKALNPRIILIPCVCHSIQLACSAAFENIIPQEVDFIISETYNWFSRSPNRQKNYLTIFQLINEGHNPLRITQSCATRWLSVESAVTRIHTQYLELKTYFAVAEKEENCFKISSLAKMYKDELNYAYLSFIKPILQDLQRVNKIFESEKADFVKVLSDLELLIKTLIKKVIIQNDDAIITEWNMDLNTAQLQSKPYLGCECEEKLFELQCSDIDILLGDPIKYEVSANTGIEMAFDSLHSISMANSELIARIQLLQDSIGKALKISQEAAARMEELQIQLSVLQRQCTFRDRPLCDTLRIRSFEENGIIDALKSLQEDQNIFRMKYLGELELDTQVKNLSTEVAISKSIFGNFPIQLKSDTVLQRNETLDQLKNIKHKTTANAHLLTHTIVSLLDKLTGTWESIEPHYKQLKSWQEVYWTLTWAISLLIIWILAFMGLTFSCFLCKSNVKAAVIMVTSVLIICLGSFVLMLFGVFTMAVGGNTEIFLCQPLFDDQNDYEFLGKLFDKPGFVYETEPKKGIIGEILKPPGQNKTFVNVNLATAIKECEQNKPSFKVFQLDAFVDTESSPTETKQYENVNKAINSIKVSEKTLLSLTQTIQTILENMLQTSDLNSTVYRANIAQPTPEKDLATFIDQMQRVALQIQDVATSARMTTLGSRAKRLQASILQPLELLRNEILYHLTALELQRDPWQRLKSHLSLDKGTVSYSSLGEKTAMCRPLFEIFDANRNFLCRNAVDSINGIWFCTFLCLLCWSIGTPLALNIISLHRKLLAINQVRGSNAHLDGNRTVTWRSGDANESPRPSPRTPRAGRTPRSPRTPRINRTSPKQQPQEHGTRRSKPLPKRPVLRQDTLESLSVRSLAGQDDESIDMNRRESEVNESQPSNQIRSIRDYRREVSSDEMDDQAATPPLQNQAQTTTVRRTFQDIRREIESEQNISDTFGNQIRTFRDIRRQIDSAEQFNDPVRPTGRTYKDIRREIESEHQQQHHQKTQQHQQELQQSQSIDQHNNYNQQERRTYRDLRRELENESTSNQNRTYRDFRQEESIDTDQNNNESSTNTQSQPRTYRDLRREIESEQQRDYRNVTRSNLKDYRERDRDKDRDRDRDREYRATKLPPAPPAPPPPIPPPDYMNINRTRTDTLYSNRINNWGLQSPSRFNREHRDPRPPVPPAPPPVPYMNRQDSVRSVRWETTEDMSFEDVDAGNPTIMVENNMV